MRVWIKRITPVFVLILAALMVTAGGILTAIMLGPYLRGEGGFTSYPAALVVGGLVIPFIVRRRYALHVQTVDGTFQWKPPILGGPLVARFGSDFPGSCSRYMPQGGD